jgi:hypothetical protein
MHIIIIGFSKAWHTFKVKSLKHNMQNGILIHGLATLLGYSYSEADRQEPVRVVI